MFSARSESCDPILPYPTMPSVSPRTSCAPAADLFHSPRCISRGRLKRAPQQQDDLSHRQFGHRPRVRVRIVEYGDAALARRLARSILSTPMQNAPTATSFFAASRTAPETRVFERTPRIGASPIFSISSRSSSAGLSDSTSISRSAKLLHRHRADVLQQQNLQEAS